MEGTSQQFVHVTAEYNSIQDVQGIVVDPQGPVVLGDVADVYFGVKEETSLSRVNGKETISIQVMRDSQVNMIDLSHKTQEVIDELKDAGAEGILIVPIDKMVM